MLRCFHWLGVLLIALAIAAVPSVAIVPSFAGGSAIDGHNEGGRYFVNPSHGQPIREVSESLWHTVYWVERLWPISVLVPGLSGLFLVAFGRNPSLKPAPAPPTEPPTWVLWLCLSGSAITVGGAWLCWVAFRAPWAVMLAGWVLACACTGAVGWLWFRSLRRPTSVAARPDRA